MTLLVHVLSPAHLPLVFLWIDASLRLSDANQPHPVASGLDGRVGRTSQFSSPRRTTQSIPPSLSGQFPRMTALRGVGTLVAIRKSRDTSSWFCHAEDITRDGGLCSDRVTCALSTLLRDSLQLERPSMTL